MDTITHLTTESRHTPAPGGSGAPAEDRAYDSVLCFGDSDWWYHNRGHADMQFMRRFARRVPVIYVNSLGVRLPNASEGRMFFRRVVRKMKSVARYYRDGGEGFGVMTPVFLPMRNGLLGRTVVRALEVQVRSVLRLRGMIRPLIWVACPTAACVIHRLPASGVVHQLSDCYTALDSGPCDEAAKMEQTIAERADLIVASSTKLHERACRRYGSASYVDHGVDFDHFDRAARAQQVPIELKNIEHPIIGFFGNIDGNTVDRALLDEVITLRPNYRFVLVGSMASDFEMLRRHANVIAVGQKPYCEIAHYGAAFDVCLMPWLQNEWIEHCNPIKLKEYLALGKPVVSTPFPELRQSENLCYEASGAEAFAAAIDRALSEDDDALREKRRTWASRHTWDVKFERVLSLLNDLGISEHG